MTSQTTALVHEAYLRLFSDAPRNFKGRAHFLAVASRVMRQVLVDYARARGTKRRGGEGGSDRPAWTTSLAVEGEAGIDRLELLESDRALEVMPS